MSTVDKLERALQLAKQEALAYAETIDNVRRVLGFKSTHYLVVANQVEDVVNALKAFQKKYPRMSNGYCTACGAHIRWLGKDKTGADKYEGECQGNCPQAMAAKALKDES